MSKKDSLNNDTVIIYYLNQVLHVMPIYNSEKEDFNSWLNRFEYAADIISIPEFTMDKVFFKMVNNNVHERIQKISPRIDFYVLPYERIITHYLSFFSPNEKYLHRRRFKCRKQYEEESIERYADRLRKIYNMCCYKSDQEEELCTQFINGIFDNVIRSKLRGTPKLSFKKTLTKAIEFSKYDLMAYYVNQAHLEINNYNPKNEGSFHDWLNKFEYVADTIGVKDDKMIKFFNRMVCTDCQASINAFFGSQLYKMSYSEIIESYLRYFSPNETDLHRKRFLCRNQYEQETIENYADCLRKIYYKCNETNRLKDELCVQFLNGIHDDEVKAYFKDLPLLPFDRTVVMVIALQKEISFRKENNSAEIK